MMMDQSVNLADLSFRIHRTFKSSKDALENTVGYLTTCGKLLMLTPTNIQLKLP